MVNVKAKQRTISIPTQTIRLFSIRVLPFHKLVDVILYLRLGDTNLTAPPVGSLRTSEVGDKDLSSASSISVFSCLLYWAIMCSVDSVLATPRQIILTLHNYSCVVHNP